MRFTLEKTGSAIVAAGLGRPWIDAAEAVEG